MYTNMTKKKISKKPVQEESALNDITDASTFVEQVDSVKADRNKYIDKFIEDNEKQLINDCVNCQKLMKRLERYEKEKVEKTEEEKQEMKEKQRLIKEAKKKKEDEFIELRTLNLKYQKLLPHVVGGLS